VTTIEGSRNVKAIAIRDLKSSVEKRFEVGGIFFKIGLIPNKAHRELLGINPDTKNYK